MYGSRSVTGLPSLSKTRKRRKQRLLGVDGRAIEFPFPTGAVGKRSDVAPKRNTCGIGDDCFRIVSGRSAAGHVGQRQSRGHRVGKAGLAHDISKEGVISRGDRGHAFGEGALNRLFRVQVIETRKIRLDQEEMHKVAVVGNNFVNLHLLAKVVSGGESHFEDDRVSVLKGSFDRRRFIHHEVGARACRCTPPYISEKQDRYKQGCGDGHGDASTAAKRRGRRHAWLELTFAGGSAKDGDQAGNQKEHECGQHRSRGLVHPFHTVGRWSVLRSFAYDPKRNDANFVDVSVESAHFNLCDSRNHGRSSNCHEEVVGSGVAIVENIGTAYMCRTDGEKQGG